MTSADGSGYQKRMEFPQTAQSEAVEAGDGIPEELKVLREYVAAKEDLELAKRRFRMMRARMLRAGFVLTAEDN